ncbi:MAG TPA: protealysin inhibitor emfourin [Egibacteraceae bacterium]|nr:protealysin inhibitor emfourin [Egibacteraceae bacterium]
MQIDFELRGGYGGLFATKPLVHRVATTDLPPGEREQLEDLVRRAGLLEGGVPPPASPAGGAEAAAERPSTGARRADTFTYRLSLRGGGRSGTYTYDDVTVPPAVRPLLTWLQKRALSARG